MNRINNHIRIAVQLMILVFMVLSLPSCRYLKQRLGLGEYSLKAAMEWAKADSARVADSLKRIMPQKKAINNALPDSIKKVISDKKAFERTLTDSLMNVAVKDIREGQKNLIYYIIVGSFANHDNAKQLAVIYSSQGYTTTILSTINRNGNKSELVSVKTFKDRTEADNFIMEFKAKTKPDAWIYTMK